MGADLVGADFLHVWEAEVGENVQGVLPVFAGLPMPPEIVIGLRQPVQGTGLIGELAEVAGEVIGGTVVSERIGGVAGRAADVAEAVQGLELVVVVAGVSREVQCPLEEVGGRPVSALRLPGHTESVQRDQFAFSVADAAGDVQGLVEAVGGRLEPVLTTVEVAESAQRVEFTQLMADLAGDVQGLVEAVGGRSEPALIFVDLSESAQRVEFTQLVAEVAGAVQGAGDQTHDFGVAAADMQVPAQRARQVQRVGRQAVVGCVRGGG
jgi:hypothetical protein